MLFLLLGLSFIALEVEARQQKHFTIMGIGDSITEGGDAFESYICPLWELLYGAGYDFDMIGPRRSYTGIGWINPYRNRIKSKFISQYDTNLFCQVTSQLTLSPSKPLRDIQWSFL